MQPLTAAAADIGVSGSEQQEAPAPAAAVPPAELVEEDQPTLAAHNYPQPDSRQDASMIQQVRTCLLGPCQGDHASLIHSLLGTHSINPSWYGTGNADATLMQVDDAAADGPAPSAKHARTESKSAAAHSSAADGTQVQSPTAADSCHAKASKAGKAKHKKGKRKAAKAKQQEDVAAPSDADQPQQKSSSQPETQQQGTDNPASSAQLSSPQLAEALCNRADNAAEVRSLVCLQPVQARRLVHVCNDLMQRQGLCLSFTLSQAQSKLKTCRYRWLGTCLMRLGLVQAQTEPRRSRRQQRQAPDALHSSTDASVQPEPATEVRGSHAGHCL